MIEMTSFIEWSTALVIVVLLLVAGSAVAYILGQRANFFVIKYEKSRSHRVVTTYEVIHAVLLAIFAVLMWSAFSNLIMNAMINDGHKDLTEITNTAIMLGTAISYLITVLLPRTFFAKGNEARYRVKKKRGVELIVIDEKDIRKGVLFRVGHEDIVYLNSNLRQKISNRAS